MPVLADRTTSHARLAVMDEKMRRDLNIAAKTQSEIGSTRSSSKDREPQDHQEQSLLAALDNKTEHTRSALDNTGRQGHQEQQALAEVHTDITDSASAAKLGEPQAPEPQEVAAFSIEALSVDCHDSGYAGSEAAFPPFQLDSPSSTSNFIFRAIGRSTRKAVKPAKWSNPQQSTGRLILTFGEKNIWEAKGPALDAFQELKPAVDDYLNAQLGTTSHPLYRVFMTGQTAEIARPTIIFYFSKSGYSKDARFTRSAFKKSGILDTYPGFKTGHSSRPSEYAALFPREDSARPQTPSHDGDKETGISNLTTHRRQSTSDGSSAASERCQRQFNASPATMHEARQSSEETKSSSSDTLQESFMEETRDVSEQTLPSFTRLTRWTTDKMRPTPEGSQRIWYLCVSLMSLKV